MKAPTIDTAKLRATLTRAHATTLEANKGDDGGTCNFGTCVMHVPERELEGIRAAFEGTGIRVSDDRKWQCGKGEVALFLYADGTFGQGFARTRAAEALERELRADGFPATMYYQVD